MTDNLGFGKEKRRQGNLDVLAGLDNFRYQRRQLSLEIFPNVNTPFLHGFVLEMALEKCLPVLQPMDIVLRIAKKFFAEVSCHDSSGSDACCSSVILMST